jgi:hypothetical protein
VAPHASPFGPNNLVQSHSGRPGVRMGEVRRWMMAGFCRRASDSDIPAIHRSGRVSPAFITTTAAKQILFIDYTMVKECMEKSTFRMGQLSDLAPILRRDECMFEADIQDAYYHLLLRKSDQPYLAFSVGGVVYVPSCLNCGLAVTPWFFARAIRPVVSYICAKGHRVFSISTIYSRQERLLATVEYGSVTVLSQVLSIKVMLEILVETTA